MYETTDSALGNGEYTRIPKSTIKLSKSCQFVCDVPMHPSLYFVETTVGWRKSVKSRGSKSSFSKSHFPEEQANYIQEDIYWAIQRGSKNICAALHSEHEQKYKSAMCCQHHIFWIIILTALFIFGGIALFVFAAGNDTQNVDTFGGILLGFGIITLMFVLGFRKIQQNKRIRLMQQLMVQFEQRVNKLDILKAKHNEWATKLIIVIKEQHFGDKIESKSYKLCIYRKLSSKTITITS